MLCFSILYSLILQCINSVFFSIPYVLSLNNHSSAKQTMTEDERREGCNHFVIIIRSKAKLFNNNTGEDRSNKKKHYKHKTVERTAVDPKALPGQRVDPSAVILEPGMKKSVRIRHAWTQKLGFLIL